MECRLSESSKEWSCQVSIRWEFNGDGTRLDTVQEVPFGPPLTNKEHVEITLRRAQAAVLNPARPQSDYLHMDINIDTLQSDNENHQLKFSSNAVCLDLQGPEFTELAFIDLSGQSNTNTTGYCVFR